MLAPLVFALPFFVKGLKADRPIGHGSYCYTWGRREKGCPQPSIRKGSIQNYHHNWNQKFYTYTCLFFFVFFLIYAMEFFMISS